MANYHVPTADQGDSPSGDTPDRNSYATASREDDEHTCIRCGDDFIREGLRKGYYCDECLDKINDHNASS